AKTVTALELGIGLAARGYSVVVADLDGQGSLSYALPLPHTPPPRPARGRGRPSAASVPLSAKPDQGAGQTAATTDDLTDYFAKHTALANIMRPTGFDRLWLLPSHPSLTRMDSGGAGHPDDELDFVGAIADLAAHRTPDGGPVDWILLDTP